jgi:hypothetical protein
MKGSKRALKVFSRGKIKYMEHFISLYDGIEFCFNSMIAHRIFIVHELDYLDIFGY